MYPILRSTLDAISARPRKIPAPYTPEILYFPMEFLTFCLSILGPTLGADSARFRAKSQHPHTPVILHFPIEFLTFSFPHWGPLLVQISARFRAKSQHPHTPEILHFPMEFLTFGLSILGSTLGADFSPIPRKIPAPAHT